MFDVILEILKLTKDEEKRIMPPSQLYNEGWMIKLVLWWFKDKDNFIINSDTDRKIVKAFKFNENATCFTEVMLETPFRPRSRDVKDNLAEPSIFVDGVVGNILIGQKKIKEKLTLSDNATQFNVFDAKIFSDNFKGTKTSPFYNQIARTIGCMVNTIEKYNGENISDVGLYIVAPYEQLISDVMIFNTDKEQIDKLIKKRVDQYGNDEEKLNWYETFKNMFKKIEVERIAWEDLIAFIKKNDSEYGKLLKEFYSDCLIYNDKK